MPVLPFMNFGNYRAVNNNKEKKSFRCRSLSIKVMYNITKHPVYIS